MNVVFYVSAAVATVSTLLVITRLNAVHALLYLIVSLLAVALIFFTLGAPFLAALEVIIYAGAIMVLFVFVVMMLNLGAEAAQQESQWLSPGIWRGPALLAVILIGEVVYRAARGGGQPTAAGVVDPKQVGKALLGPNRVGGEFASLLLLAGLVGAYHLGRRTRPETGGEGEA